MTILDISYAITSRYSISWFIYSLIEAWWFFSLEVDHHFFIQVTLLFWLILSIVATYSKDDSHVILFSWTFHIKYVIRIFFYLLLLYKFFLMMKLWYLLLLCNGTNIVMMMLICEQEHVNIYKFGLIIIITLFSLYFLYQLH